MTRASSRKGSRSKALAEQTVALAWGVAEGTLFFIVPDVFLSWLAVDKRRRGFAAVVPAIVGALIGGTVMWAWGRADRAGVVGVLDRIPAIRPDMLERVQTAMETDGLLPMLWGPLRGTPYKIFAATWGGLDGSLVELWLMSVPARGIRFFVVSALAWWAIGRPLAKKSLATRRAVLIGCWVAFYAWYFAVMAAP